MSRYGGHHLRALGVVTLALVLTLAAALVARSWSQHRGGSYAPARTVTATSLDPPSVLFGDPVAATARIVVDSRAVDPASVSLDPSFKPFQAFASRRTVVDGVGHATEVRYVFTLQCVTGACINAMERQRGGARRTVPIALPDATARARGRDGAALAIPVRWPTLTMHSRLTADDIAKGDPVAPSFVAVGVDHGHAPSSTGWLLVVIAAVLLLTAGGLVASVLIERRREKRLRLPAHLGPVDRALALARHALDDGDLDGGRKALERLATELERSGRDDLAETAGRIAWSPPGPTIDEVDDLARLVESGVNGR